MDTNCAQTARQKCGYRNVSSSPPLLCSIMMFAKKTIKNKTCILEGFYHGDDVFTESLAYSSVVSHTYFSIACCFYVCVAKPACDIFSQKILHQYE